jgi:signal-transduction protein with cAMP-binding, CBS, and nucleotidyltransferase domain
MDEIQQKKILVKNQSCFAELSGNEIEILASLLREKKFKKDEIIVSMGEPVDGFYLIAEGRAVVKVGPDSIALLKAENYDAIGLNELGFYSLSGLRTATVIAETDMILYYLALPVFHGFALNYPHVSQVMREQAQRFLNRSI